jgi:hypothetical protein
MLLRRRFPTSLLDIRFRDNLYLTQNQRISEPSYFIIGNSLLDIGYSDNNISLCSPLQEKATRTALRLLRLCGSIPHIRSSASTTCPMSPPASCMNCRTVGSASFHAKVRGAIVI